MKRNEILQIICVAIGIYYIISFLFGVVGVGMLLSMNETEYISKNSQIFWTSIGLVLMLALSLILIFKNQIVISIIQSKKYEDESPEKNNRTVKPNLSFWIQVIGLYYFVSSISELLSQVPIVIASDGSFVSDTYWWSQTGSSLIGLIVSLVFILKNADIEKFVKSRTERTQQDTTADGENAGGLTG